MMCLHLVPEHKRCCNQTLGTRYVDPQLSARVQGRDLVPRAWAPCPNFGLGT